MPKRDGLRKELKNAGRMDKSKPGWQDGLIGAIDKNRDENSKGTNTRRQLAHNRKAYGGQSQFFSGREFRRLVKQAAALRGISNAGYMRRAVAAFVMHDLGLPANQVLHDSPTASAAGQMAHHSMKSGADNMQGFGPWEIESLRE